MKIAVIGTGYVGLVQGIIMSEFGSEVICVDKSQEKIEILNKGELPIYEPGLAELLHKNQKAKRISFTTDIEKAIKKSEVIFIAVGTPAMEDGSADLSAVLNVADEIGEYINSYKVIVDKSFPYNPNLTDLLLLCVMPLKLPGAGMFLVQFADD